MFWKREKKKIYSRIDSISQKRKDKMKNTIDFLMNPYSGILAIDERAGTLEKRFENLNIPTNKIFRRGWRELMLNTPNLRQFISGVILSDETFNDVTSKAIPFPKAFQSKNILIGIKVDEGTIPIREQSLEKVTTGLRGLRNRIKEYREKGASFAKWRCIFTIGGKYPTRELVEENLSDLTEYAKICIEEGIVPILEPEVLWDGGHSIEESKNTVERVLKRLFRIIKNEGVPVSNMILKTSMVMAGKNNAERSHKKIVGEYTAHTLARSVPHTIGGVVFLSGGQSPYEAVENLNEISKVANDIRMPFETTFSFGRALQDEAMVIWGGKDQNEERSQNIFYETIRKNGFAREGDIEKA